MLKLKNKRRKQKQAFLLVLGLFAVGTIHARMGDSPALTVLSCPDKMNLGLKIMGETRELAQDPPYVECVYRSITPALIPGVPGKQLPYKATYQVKDLFLVEHDRITMKRYHPDYDARPDLNFASRILFALCQPIIPLQPWLEVRSYQDGNAMAWPPMASAYSAYEFHVFQDSSVCTMVETNPRNPIKMN